MTMPNNIIFYFTDQQRWDTCGCFGQPLEDRKSTRLNSSHL